MNTYSAQPVLRAATAEEMMSPNPVSINSDATVHEAAALLTDRNVSAAPVIDNRGRPIGVLSRADLVRYTRERAEYLWPRPHYYDTAELETAVGPKAENGFQVEDADLTTVAELMTPAVYGVSPDTPATEVAREMERHKVHRLFVMDNQGVLIGVVSVMDLLRRLTQ